MEEQKMSRKPAEGKKKRKSDVVFKIIIIILICIIGVSLYKVSTILWEYHQGSKQYDQVKEVANTEKSTDNIEWKSLMNKYKNVKAWLYSKNTVINYPVVQGNDNSYYLHHMVNGKTNWKGTLFIDYRCKKPFQDHLTIIYGHHMNDGSMFRSLVNYRKHDYYVKHPKMLLITPDAKYDIEIFAVDTIPSDSDKYKFYFSGDADKQAYLNWIRKKSELNTKVKVSSNDKLVMLSTCTYEFEQARLVVYGKLVKKG